MKIYFIFILIFFLNNCSFDTKTGIWNSENIKVDKKNDIFKEFEKISIEDESFKTEITLKKGTKLKISTPINNLNWQDVYFNDENNFQNFTYNNANQIIFKSKKLTRNKLNKYPIYHNSNLIVSDHKGNIIVFSLDTQKIISKFNFYKKKFKKVQKILNLYIDNDIIFVTDNLGYLYSLDYLNNKVIWAINHKVPLNSNLKITDDKIICSDINNNLIYFNKNNGEILKLIPTENTTLTNEFNNNISKYNEDLFFINSFGSLYSSNIETMNLNWFVNLNSSSDLNKSNLFNGSKIVTNGDKVIVSSTRNTYLIDNKTGSIIKKLNFASKIKPIINNKICFFLTKNNFLIAFDLENNQILHSQDINSTVAKYLKTKKQELNYKIMMLLNNELVIFLKNSYILNFTINGKLKEIKKLPSKINTFPILIDSSIIFLNSKKKLIIVN